MWNKTNNVNSEITFLIGTLKFTSEKITSFLTKFTNLLGFRFCTTLNCLYNHQHHYWFAYKRRLPSYHEVAWFQLFQHCKKRLNLISNEEILIITSKTPDRIELLIKQLKIIWGFYAHIFFIFFSILRFPCVSNRL